MSKIKVVCKNSECGKIWNQPRTPEITDDVSYIIVNWCPVCEDKANEPLNERWVLKTEIEIRCQCGFNGIKDRSLHTPKAAILAEVAGCDDCKNYEGYRELYRFPEGESGEKPKDENQGELF